MKCSTAVHPVKISSSSQPENASPEEEEEEENTTPIINNCHPFTGQMSSNYVKKTHCPIVNPKK